MLQNKLHFFDCCPFYRSFSFSSNKISQFYNFIYNLQKIQYFFPSLQADGIFQILQSDWFWERAVFYDLAS